jgi:hypothetical protein
MDVTPANPADATTQDPEPGQGILCPECGSKMDTRRTLQGHGFTVRYRRCRANRSHTVRTEETIVSSARIKQMQKTGAELASEKLGVPRDYASQLADVAAGSYSSGAPVSSIATALGLPVSTITRMLTDKGLL